MLLEFALISIQYVQGYYHLVYITPAGSQFKAIRKELNIKYNVEYYCECFDGWNTVYLTPGRLRFRDK